MLLSDMVMMTMAGRRRLEEEQEVLGNSTIPSETEEQITDSEVLKQTFMIYGPLFVVVWLSLCCLKWWWPKAYNLRSWVPKLQCNLAKEQYGFISWSWRVYSVSDEDILNQCGMDALCLCRATSYAVKLSLIGILISVFLFPIYKTAPDEADTIHITDRVVEMTIANVPDKSNRLYAAVAASYIFYISAWIILSHDFSWFRKNRIKFLSKPKPRNYSIYVGGIPRDKRSNQALANYFCRILNEDAVYQASVALSIPGLQQKVKSRTKVVQKLEHCLALKQIKGITPTLRPHGPLGGSVDSIEMYQSQLAELNAEISTEIARIEDENDVSNAQPREDDDDGNDFVGSSRLENFRSCQGEAVSDDDVELSGSENYTHADQSVERLLSKSASEGSPRDTVTSAVEAGTLGAVHDSKPKPWTGMLPKTAALFGRGDSEYTEAYPLPKHEDEPPSSSLSALPVEQENETTRDNDEATRENDKSSRTISSHGRELKHLVTKAVPFIHGNEDGTPLHAGFVSFTSLTDANASIQVIHSTIPHQMIVLEAPNHEGILWRNVGLPYKSVQLGTVVAFCLSALLCLFWTIPVSFALSLTSAESISERSSWGKETLEKYPWIGSLLDQLGPLILSIFNSFLPQLLKFIASFEGHIGESHLEASLFSKLSAFHIIQTFFVTNIAGSLTLALQYFWEDPTEIVTFLAYQLPPQSTFYIQLVMINLVCGMGFECLRVFPLLQVRIRETFGPHLTEKERNRMWNGLRPLSDPRNFFHARSFANLVLYLMVLFVYTTIAPISCYVLAFCFLASGAANRNQFFYIYSTNPDSGGMLWMIFVDIALSCMAVAQITLGAYLALKQANVAAGLMVPLLIFQILFHISIHQRHFKVAQRIPTEDSIELDEHGPMDFSFLRDKYKQSALKVKDLEPEYPDENGKFVEEDTNDAVPSAQPDDANVDEERPESLEEVHKSATP